MATSHYLMGMTVCDSTRSSIVAGEARSSCASMHRCGNFELQQDTIRTFGSSTRERTMSGI